MRGAGVVGSLAAVLVGVASLIGCGDQSGSVSSVTGAPITTTPSPSTTTSSPGTTQPPTSVVKPTGCAADPPFHATVLPKGFEPTLKVGRPHQIPWDTTVRYYSGTPGAFIDIYPSALPAWRPANVIQLHVLNTTGEFGLVEDGYSVAFHLPCGEYTLLSSGVSADEFKSVIAGLTAD